MDHTLIDDRSLKTLEDYAVLLAGAMITLRTLHNFEVKAVNIGIMPEDMIEKANTIAWDLRRLIKQYEIQTASALELIGDGFDYETVIARLREKEMVRARAMTKKPKKDLS